MLPLNFSLSGFFAERLSPKHINYIIQQKFPILDEFIGDKIKFLRKDP